MQVFKGGRLVSQHRLHVPIQYISVHIWARAFRVKERWTVNIFRIFHRLKRTHTEYEHVPASEAFQLGILIFQHWKNCFEKWRPSFVKALKSEVPKRCLPKLSQDLRSMQAEFHQNYQKALCCVAECGAFIGWDAARAMHALNNCTGRSSHRD